MALRLMGEVHALPGKLGAVNQPLLPFDVHRLGGCLTRGRGQLDPTQCLLRLSRLLGPHPRGPLSVEHDQLRRLGHGHPNDIVEKQLGGLPLTERVSLVLVLF